VHIDPAQVHLTIGGEFVETTPEHPFFTQERGWVDAGELRVGEHIHRANEGYGIVESVMKDGVLWTAVEVPEAFKRQGIGQGLFSEAWRALGDKAVAIGGKWNTAMPDNLNTFNAKLNAGRSLEQAALETFTGKQAIARGFGQVEFHELRGPFGAYTNVEVIFR
jgi:hypothetical protein